MAGVLVAPVFPGPLNHTWLSAVYLRVQFREGSARADQQAPGQAVNTLLGLIGSDLWLQSRGCRYKAQKLRLRNQELLAEVSTKTGCFFA